ncbi:hypothetical protein G6L00_09405 [Agrobacterium rhizogenes]|nr:hypothetical protein [Rhizobium rhizogenes]NTH38146.1 hypothetical protein [Rhizobium rhizogenes]NTJ00576.1 hypothetical protein [Rhizobium rhizogenes]
MKGKFTKHVAAQKKNANNERVFSDLEKRILNHSIDKDGERPHVNLKYYSPNFECFSSWTSDEMKAFSTFVEKLRTSKWQTIFNSGGSIGQKTGFALTLLEPSNYPQENQTLDSLSQDIKLFELRVDQKIRVHGFRCHDGFFLVYLDREHRISKG